MTGLAQRAQLLSAAPDLLDAVSAVRHYAVAVGGAPLVLEAVRVCLNVVKTSLQVVEDLATSPTDEVGGPTVPHAGTASNADTTAVSTATGTANTLRVFQLAMRSLASVLEALGRHDPSWQGVGETVVFLGECLQQSYDIAVPSLQGLVALCGSSVGTKAVLQLEVDTVVERLFAVFGQGVMLVDYTAASSAAQALLAIGRTAGPDGMRAIHAYDIPSAVQTVLVDVASEAPYQLTDVLVEFVTAFLLPLEYVAEGDVSVVAAKDDGREELLPHPQLGLVIDELLMRFCSDVATARPRTLCVCANALAALAQRFVPGLTFAMVTGNATEEGAQSLVEQAAETEPVLAAVAQLIRSASTFPALFNDDAAVVAAMEMLVHFTTLGSEFVTATLVAAPASNLIVASLRWTHGSKRAHVQELAALAWSLLGVGPAQAEESAAQAESLTAAISTPKDSDDMDLTVTVEQLAFELWKLLALTTIADSITSTNAAWITDVVSTAATAASALAGVEQHRTPRAVAQAGCLAACVCLFRRLAELGRSAHADEVEVGRIAARAALWGDHARVCVTSRRLHQPPPCSTWLTWLFTIARKQWTSRRRWLGALSRLLKLPR